MIETITAGLCEYLNSTLVDGRSNPLSIDEQLIATGRVDSLGLMSLFEFIQQRYKVNLLPVAEPKDLETIRSLANAILLLSQESDRG
jgi:acyl carrier protein